MKRQRKKERTHKKTKKKRKKERKKRIRSEEVLAGKREREKEKEREIKAERVVSVPPISGDPLSLSLSGMLGWKEFKKKVKGKEREQ